MSKRKSTTLSDKINDILSTTPSGNFDPEDDVDTETSAKVVDHLEDENATNEFLDSKFRKQNVDYLEQVDKRYEGVKASRKSLENYSEEDETSLQQSDSNDDSFSEEEESEVSQDSGEENQSETASEESADESKFRHVSSSNAPLQIKKGNSVRNQLQMWENLLETRIQLQKCLLSSNKFPQFGTFQEIKRQSGSEFDKKITETKTCLKTLLNSLLQLQKLMLNNYPETKNLFAQKQDNNTDEGEEIPSETDEESTANEEPVLVKRQKFDDYEKEISQRHKVYKEYQRGVVQKWNEKTRLISIKNSANNHSALNQIDYVLGDKSKLIRRTQLKRSEYSIVGSGNGSEAGPEGDNYNEEIFDDDDFYHQMLRELIEFKSSDITDPVQLGRQWIQLQNLRSKMKRKIDTRATKGRKLRYLVHSKLVNFMAPIDEGKWTEESKTELFNSLFGQRKN